MIKEVAHVRTLEDGLRCVDYVSVDRKTLAKVLQSAPVVGWGRSALVFGYKATESKKVIYKELTTVIRLPFYNQLGQSYMIWVMSLAAPQINDPNFNQSITKIKSLQLGEYNKRVASLKKEIEFRVACANATFRRDPSLTIPINMILTSHNIPVATVEKHIEGKHPLFESEYADMQLQLENLGVDFARKNIFFDVSPYENGEGKKFLHPFHVIDFLRFIPSDEKI